MGRQPCGFRCAWQDGKPLTKLWRFRNTDKFVAEGPGSEVVPWVSGLNLQCPLRLRLLTTHSPAAGGVRLWNLREGPVGGAGH